MKRLTIEGDERLHAEEVVQAAGFEVVRSDPEIVLCHGGDGTLLRAERRHPGVPKVPVRIGFGMNPCPEHTLDVVVRRLASGRLEREELDLIELRVGKQVFRALNDVVLRNDNPAFALRFRLIIDDVPSEEYTGDGLVIATPFGSTAYFRSVTGQQIDSGIGIAFNNSTRRLEPLIVEGAAPVTVVLERGAGVLVYDNDHRGITMREGHRFSFRRSPRRATVLGLDALRCQRCRRRDGAGFNPH